MKKRQYLLLVILSVVAGLVGGALSGKLSSGVRADTQTTQRYEKILAEAIAAKEFILVDEHNTIRAVLGPLNGTGLVPRVSKNARGLWLYDNKGWVSAYLIYDPDDEALSTIGLMTPDPTKRVVIRQDGVYVEDGKTHLALEGDSLTLTGSSILARAELSVESGRPVFKLYDENNIVRAALGAVEIEVIRTGELRDRTESSLILFDNDGEVIWSAP